MKETMSITPDYPHVHYNSCIQQNLTTIDLPMESSSVFIEILKRVYIMTLPVICMAGVIGNVLAFFVFVSKPLRRTSCSWYLAARSVSDGSFLLASLLTWGSDASKLRYFHTDGLCQVIVFLTYVFAFMSVWLTVIVTIENYVRICRPFSVQAFCNVVVARRTIAGVLCAGVALYNYPLWTTKVFALEVYNTTDYWCTGDTQYDALLKWLSFLDMLATLVVPSLIIIILMIAITFSLIKAIKRQARLQSGSRTTRSNGHKGRGDRSTRSSSSPQAKVTGMLFAVSFCFIILNGPIHVIRLVMIIDEFMGNTNASLSLEEQVQVVFQFIYYLSFAVNLVIYLTCGHSFRRQFKETYFVLCLRHQSPRGHSEMTAMSVVRLEEDNRNEDLRELIDNGACTSFVDSRT